MYSNVTDAMADLIRQQTKAQLARDWDKAEAEMAARRARYARVTAFFGRQASVTKASFDAGVVRELRA